MEICDFCGNKFNVLPCRKKQKYCTFKCYTKSKIGVKRK